MRVRAVEIVRTRGAGSTVGLLFLVSLLRADPVDSQSAREVPARTSRVAAIDTSRRAIAAMMERTRAPGVGVAVALGGELVWSDGLGLADIEREVAVSDETKFGIGSISKSVTMVLCGRLVDRGLLEWDAPIETYLADFPWRGEGITVRLIGGHLSGLDDSVGHEIGDTHRHFDHTHEVLELLYERPLVSRPGSEYAYGTITYTVIAGVIEQVTGMSFFAALDEHVLAPLGMAHTVLNDRRAIIPGRTSFYVIDDDGVIVNAPYFDPSYVWAGAGLLSTARDLVTLGSALLSSDFLTPETRAELFRPMRTTNGEPTGDGLGWRLTEDAWLRPCIQKSGGGYGVAGVLALWPEHDLVVAVLSNRSWTPVGGEVLDAIADAFLGPGG